MPPRKSSSKKTLPTQPPLSLADRFRSSFDPIIRMRGEDYFKSGRITDFLHASGGISATVKGSRVYHVSLRWHDRNSDEILGLCTCPHYEQGDLCKHIWAVIREADKAGLGRLVRGSQELTVVHAFEAAPEDREFDDDEDDDEFEDFDDDDLATNSYSWQEKIRLLQQQSHRHGPESPPEPPSKLGRPRLAFYVLDLSQANGEDELKIQFFHRERLQNDSFGQLKRSQVGKQALSLYEEPADREIMAFLLLLEEMENRYDYDYIPTSSQKFSSVDLNDAAQGELLRKIAATGRLVRFAGGKNEMIPVGLDDGPPWQFEVAIEPVKGFYRLSGRLHRAGESVDLSQPLAFLPSGFVVFPDRIAKFDGSRYLAWILALHSQALQPIPESESADLVEALCSSDDNPPVRWPADLQWENVSMTPVPLLMVAPGGPAAGSAALILPAELRFIYGETEISQGRSSSTVFDKKNRQLITRDFEFEKSCSEKLLTLQGVAFARNGALGIGKAAFAQVAGAALSWGWLVKAFGNKVSAPSDFDIQVQSGIDWFELQGGAAFANGIRLGLPDLLSALRNPSSLIQLGDGTTGLLPQKWLERYGSLAEIGHATEAGLRFSRSQGALLAAWLGTDQIKADPDFSALRESVLSINDLQPRQPDASFKGELRPYQKEGLAWLGFLSNVDFGGILADDMGLGKTVQVLAHLQSEYQAMLKDTHRPTLIVVPKSLIFNWQDEAARFAPNLRVIAYRGSERGHRLRLFETHDIVLVTYATLRRDIEEISQKEFHYVIADEAQAIKNPASQAHRACCALHARHRLAMTGTPVENSALDLLALLDFVSPGLLGRGLRERMTRAAQHSRLDTETLRQLSQALKPFILRRTKEQVLRDLPDKTEKVIHCELSATELRRYRELRDHYRTRLKAEFARQGGIASSKIAVLEALLRLRQAACHPGLIDKKLATEDSAKIDILLEQIQEIVAEGHKALVFSQFTSFLDIAEHAFEREEIPFVRLDGKTSDSKRRDLVSRFQSDPQLKVFLISLKAGGVGLNLTAADYVFILDPWWNPAAEAQAIDRTHRIGQMNKVIAYRLIAKDTVEEKIIELQKQKREIADAIISEDASLMKKLTVEDIETLLS